ncbi:hypothetical protein BTHE68_42890 [Burkholderia sp. THE68]|uniref:alpha/beta fold hydrolase n=1 Tax=Burkholderia sp. THE68 TaxID=758782 RepID=UPI001318690D|nr:hypothetical protein [Burkholderia sp. THE68]BBU30555.1 hypothetical protein BTHE68_42890 [Burkholderia sp. THE68]
MKSASSASGIPTPLHTWQGSDGVRLAGDTWGHPDGEVADAIAVYRPSQSRRRNLGGLAKNVRLDNDGRYRWHWDPNFLARPIDPHARHARLADAARRLALPTLLVRGGSSDVVSEAVREFIDLCPHAEYVNIAQAGHMVAGDRNDLFGNAAIDFLARPGGSAKSAGST